MSILAQPATVPLRARPELVDALEACLQHLQEAAHDGDLEGAACWRADGTPIGVSGGLARAGVRFMPEASRPLS